MSNSILRDKAKEFAKNIVLLCRNMKSEHKETVLINQLLRSGTSIGANIAESQFGQSRRDFIAKRSIAIKEASESKYWLELLVKSEYIDSELYKELDNDVTVIIKMLTSSLKTLKSKE